MVNCITYPCSAHNNGNLIGFILQFVLVKFMYWAFAMNVYTNGGWQVLWFLVLSTWWVVVSLSAFPWGKNYIYSEGCWVNINHSGVGDEYKDFFNSFVWNQILAILSVTNCFTFLHYSGNINFDVMQ